MTATPIAGPSALGGSRRRFAYLAATLALTDFKLRFFGSALGYLWQLVRPLLLFGVLYFVFTRFVKIGGAVTFYPVVLLANIVLYQFFADGTGAVDSLVERESLVRKIQFPRAAVPVAVVLTASFNLLLNLLVVLAFALASGVTPTWRWLQAPLLVGALALLVVGLAMLLSALFVRYRDVKPIWEVALQILFYGSPIFYPIDVVLENSELAAKLMMLNPLAASIQQGRHALIAPSHPSAGDVLGSDLLLAAPVAITLAVFTFGFWVFSRRAPGIAEEI